MQSAATGELVGAVLNQEWRLLRLIGEGGLGSVYEADGVRGQGRRAIKVLHSQFHSSRIVVERFYAEAKASYSLRHPHIAATEAYAYAEDGTPYIVMELLVGMPLDEHMRKFPPMAPGHAAPLLFGVLQALGVAHANGIVHRDLKPPNLFLVPDASAPAGQIVKVLDFGIAKVMDLAGGMATKTRTGAMLGTPGYMSAEQIKNAKAVDARSDLWAAGVVLFEMLTHEHPFGADDGMGRVVNILRGQARPISEAAPHLAAWGPFFETALDVDPARRFQSAEQMATALREVAFAGQGATAAQVSAPMPLTNPISPHGSPHLSPHPSPQISTLSRGASPTGGTLASGAYAAPGAGTTLTNEAPHYTRGYAPPIIHIESARRADPPRLVWWGAVLACAAAFGLGVLVGYLVGAS